jgi:hypothetical protein
LLSRRGFKYKLRHWPPGTDKSPFVPPFFCSLRSVSSNFPLIALQSYRRIVAVPFPPRYTEFLGASMRRLLVCLAVGMLTVAAYAQWVTDPNVPAYHATAPAHGDKLPPLLSGSQLAGPMFQYPWQKAVYVDAAKVPNVLYQLPCYCHCDRNMGHTSLHSCFEGLHGAECSTCAKEGYYAYQMSLKGKTAREIREGVMRGDFESIDLNAIGL